jgi:hypothetical protein
MAGFGLAAGWMEGDGCKEGTSAETAASCVAASGVGGSVFGAGLRVGSGEGFGVPRSINF